MNEMFRQSLFAGVTISLIAYEIGLFLKRKLGLAILNPLLVSIVIVILALKGCSCLWNIIRNISKFNRNFCSLYVIWIQPQTVCNNAS